MSKLQELVAVVQTVLIDAAESLARSSGFVKRSSKMTASCFVQSMVLGSLHQPELHLRDLVQTAALGNVTISPQGIDKRFSAASVRLMRGVLEILIGSALCKQFNQSASAEQTAAALPEVLGRFTRVELIDSTVLALPRELAEQWPGCNSTQGASAAMKLDVLFDLSSGALTGPEIRPGRAHDATAELARQIPSAGALRVQDLGYFSLEQMGKIARAEAYYLSRYKGGTTLYDAQSAQPIDLLALLTRQTTVDLPVHVGTAQLPMRLLATPVAKDVADTRRRQLRHKACKHSSTPSRQALGLCGWTVLLTNVPAEMLSRVEANAVLGARWQIELLFKRWKSNLKLASSCSRKPEHILTEIYAKLIAVLLQQWMLRLGVWQIPDRSLSKAALVIGRHALMLLRALGNRRQLRTVLQMIIDSMQVYCRLDRRRGQPSTYQKLVAATQAAP
jgi:hypothetical protein